MDYKIQKEEFNFKSMKALIDGLDEHAKEKKGLPAVEPFGFYIKEGEKVLGGMQGILLYGVMHIQLFWISKELRGKGMGTQLYESAQAFAKEKKCSMIMLETFDFNALDFYKKLGFKIDLERKGFMKNSIFYYLSKSI